MAELSRAQQEIVGTFGEPLFVAAGAGSGKTFTLVRKLVEALEPDGTGEPRLESLGDALVITFTRRAAEEIKGRVRSELVARGRHEEALLLDTAWVSTIHGMCERILRSCALELGIDPAFSVVTGHRASYLQSQAIDEVLTAARVDERYRLLFERYGASLDAVSLQGVNGRMAGRPGRHAATAPEMAERLFSLATTSLSGFDGLRFPGTPLDARELLARVGEAYEDLLAIWSPTTPAATSKHQKVDEALGTLRRALDGDELGAQEASSLLTALYVPDKRGAKGEVADAIERLKVTVGNARLQVAYELETRPLEKPLLDLARAIGRRYDALKRESGALDTDDLLRLTFDALRHDEGVARRFRGRFKLVMVDEFQDTDPQQLEIVRLLAASPDALCFVGDGQQSIYRFRGADVTQYERAKDAAPNVRHLDRNYRSHDDILRFVSHSLGVSGILPGFMDLTADPDRRDAFPAGVAHRVMIEHTASDGAPLDALKRRNAEQVAERLQELNRQGVPARDMALLLRSMADADLYIQELRAHKLDAVMTKGSSFAQASEVRLVRSILVALANPHDTRDGLIPVLQSPVFGLSDDDLASLAHGGGGDMAEVLLAGPDRLCEFTGEEPSQRLKAAMEVLDRARARMATQSVADTLLSVCAESGWIARLEQEGPAGRSRAANVLACVRRVREIVDDEGLGFSHAPKVFGDWLTSAKEPPAAVNAEKSTAVSVMTIHGAKGLEFPVVAVAGCFDDAAKAVNDRLIVSPSESGRDLALMPESFSRDDKERRAFSALRKTARETPRPARPVTGLDWRLALEDRERDAETREAARLLYVALTRAEDALVLGIVTKEAKDGPSPALAARFLDAAVGAVPVEEATEEFEYGGEFPGEVRTTWVAKSDGGAEEPDTEAPALDEPRRIFALYEEPRVAPPVRPWRVAWDVRSYSADRHQAETEAALAADGHEHQDDDPASWALTVEETQGSPATSFGDAFHELAREVAESRSPVTDGRVAAAARFRSLDARAEQRLRRALDAWWGSDARIEAWTYPQLVGEAPFFQRLEAEGGYLTGSIDLLATDGDRAFVVDYKTGERGLDAAGARAEHEMQARYYAHVLIAQGFATVRCAFVLVENLVDGRPLTVDFEFEGPEPPPLGELPHDVVVPNE